MACNPANYTLYWWRNHHSVKRITYSSTLKTSRVYARAQISSTSNSYSSQACWKSKFADGLPWHLFQASPFRKNLQRHFDSQLACDSHRGTFLSLWGADKSFDMYLYLLPDDKVISKDHSLEAFDLEADVPVQEEEEKEEFLYLKHMHQAFGDP